MIRDCDFWKEPHIIKIPEALTAIADSRFQKIGENELCVYSSDLSKKYTVKCFEDGYFSNDNMSYNKGMLGYPIVVELILEEKIHIDMEIARLFSHINWTQTNMLYNKDFSRSMEAVIEKVADSKYSQAYIREYIEEKYKELIKLLPGIKRYTV